MKRRASPQQWTLRRRIGWSFLSLGIVLVLLMAVLALSTVQFVRTGNRVVYRWEPAVAASQRLLIDLVDQETGLRGYALSQNPDALAPYQSAAGRQAIQVKGLMSLIGSDRAARRRLDAVVIAADHWHTIVANPAIAAIRQGSAAGPALVRSAVAKQRFDRIRVRSAELAHLVQKRADDARVERRFYGVVFVVAISLTAIMLMTIAVAIWRGLHRWVLDPVERLGSQTRHVSSGDTYRQIVPDGPVEFAALGRDVEAMRLQIAGQLARAEEIQEQLRQRSEELARSNDDLQQFAYVASHDLSEPLRKVANFCQLLERQYGDQLDERAKQYIDFAVDGAKRMQALISDLLALSRVGRTTDEFVPVSLDDALDTALGNLGDRMEETGAQVERLTALPTIQGDRSLLVSLLENLVGNAVKYRREDVPPVVRISAAPADDAGTWTFTVRDNGIGIDPQYAERIFAVFQRLHLRDSYGGTGIGLALCRKIVEFHGGRIWLEPVESGDGAEFQFTLPEGAVFAESRD